MYSQTAFINSASSSMSSERILSSPSRSTASGSMWTFFPGNICFRITSNVRDPLALPLSPMLIVFSIAMFSSHAFTAFWILNVSLYLSSRRTASSSSVSNRKSSILSPIFIKQSSPSANSLFTWHTTFRNSNSSRQVLRSSRSSFISPSSRFWAVVDTCFLTIKKATASTQITISHCSSLNNVYGPFETHTTVHNKPRIFHNLTTKHNTSIFR
ncbi:hypothetical protein PsorP6_002260 [Peronosclerospora sorghi]|uniref:Uncharacterized protein n=1 Tax=Peronosclerospora sorghi TaxID=230839 RepID=A0ACC0WVH1_9STRA|nr:hypothetical protein PsorP6_002260 [Peronosclerospora sorghi]